jgi:2-methylcitrate dehydratase
MSIERRAHIRFPRRRFLKGIAAASLATGLPRLPAIAQDKSDRPALAETLARYAASLKYEDIPEDVVRLAKRTILDTIGCTFGGYDAGPSRIAIRLAGDVSAKQPATVLISGTKTAPDLAVFANGVMIRYLDFNDAFVSLPHGAGHPSDTIAALLSSAEIARRSGRDLITATFPMKCSARSPMSSTISATASIIPPSPAWRRWSAPAG